MAPPPHAPHAPHTPTHSARRPAGHVIMVDPGGVELMADTLQCVHCGAHWIVKPGSGRKRGFCLKCMGPTCGSPRCEHSCNPVEAQIEAMEAAGDAAVQLAGGLYVPAAASLTTR